jgi:hypothetical protein
MFTRSRIFHLLTVMEAPEREVQSLAGGIFKADGVDAQISGGSRKLRHIINLEKHPWQ